MIPEEIRTIESCFTYH